MQFYFNTVSRLFLHPVNRKTRQQSCFCRIITPAVGKSIRHVNFFFSLTNSRSAYSEPQHYCSGQVYSLKDFLDKGAKFDRVCHITYYHIVSKIPITFVFSTHIDCCIPRKMSRKSDKELNRLKHELENVRQQYNEARKQNQLKDIQLDAANKLESENKAQGFQDENDALRKELASAKEAVRTLETDSKRAAQEYAQLREDYDNLNIKQSRKIAELSEELVEWTELNLIEKKVELTERRLKAKGEEEANAILRGSGCPNGTCNVIIEELKAAAKEDAEKHKQETEASSQKLKTLTDHFTQSSRSYMAVAEMYPELIEDSTKRDSSRANNAPGTDFEEQLPKHNDLKRDDADRVQECSELDRPCQEQNEGYKESQPQYVP